MKFNETYQKNDTLKEDVKNIERIDETPFLVSSAEKLGDAIDLVGVRIFIKFGVMTQVETTQLDGRVRRLFMHEAYKEEYRNIQKYTLFPKRMDDVPTCYKELYDVTCEKLAFLDRLNKLLYDVGLSHDAIEDYCA